MTKLIAQDHGPARLGILSNCSCNLFALLRYNIELEEFVGERN